MKLIQFTALGLAVVTSAMAATKWEPYKFKAGEKYEFKIVTQEDGAPTEIGYGLEIRKKGEDKYDVTWTTRSVVGKEEMGEKYAWGGMATQWATTWVAMNPMYAAFIQEVELEEGSKMSVLGAGVVKVTKKETVAGRTGFVCQWYSKQDNQEVLDAAWTVDPELALPIRCITYEEGKEKYRVELTSYKKD